MTDTPANSFNSYADMLVTPEEDEAFQEMEQQQNAPVQPVETVQSYTMDEYYLLMNRIRNRSVSHPPYSHS